MNCPHCHKPIPARARYCIHCGAEQEPTPIAAVAAASMAVRGRREAANAAQAEAAPAVAMRPTPGASIVELPSAARARDPGDAAGAVDAPAYASAPPRRALATGLVVACFVVGAIVLATAWWLHVPMRAADPATTAQSAVPATPSPAASEATTPATAGASADGQAASAPAASPNADDATRAGERPAATAETGQAVEITPLPPARVAAHGARTAPRAAEAPKPAAERAPGRPATPSAAPATPATASAPAVALAPPAAAPVTDRWARMDVELSQCTREDFIARVVCGQRVRFRYCDGYWGKVPACPGSPAVERGQ